GTATTLADGRVLVAGGLGSAGAQSVAQIYDPKTNAWIAAKSMSSKRQGHAAIAIAGKVLVFGGHDGTSYLDSAEMYDPARDEWVGAGTMSTKRFDPAAAALDGKRVLVVGGRSSDVLIDLASAEILTLDPGADGTSCAFDGDCVSLHCADRVCCS